MNQELNYKHLYYFWVTAKEGGMSHAAARLGMAIGVGGRPARR